MNYYVQRNNQHQGGLNSTPGRLHWDFNTYTLDKIVAGGEGK